MVHWFLFRFEITFRIEKFKNLKLNGNPAARFVGMNKLQDVWTTLKFVFTNCSGSQIILKSYIKSEISFRSNFFFLCYSIHEY